MTFLNDLPLGARVGVDSAAIIYYVEAHPDFGPLVNPFFLDRLDKNLNEAFTSTVSLTEVLIQPLRTGRADLVASYRAGLAGVLRVAMVSITPPVAERAAALRA